jgi:hypothetical protein
MIIYFNNCRGRDYTRIYKKNGIFYDLKTVGIQANQVPGLRVGQECIVAAPATNGQVNFSWFSFLYEDPLTDETGARNRVLFGDLIKSESLSKEKAARHSVYSAFFDKNGHFKRRSVIKR